MGDTQRIGPGERDIEQAITALKKGATLLKYGRRGKPKFCPFRLSNDESTLIWYSGKEEKHLKLAQVSRIIPGQRTAIFQRYPRPEKEYQSFSLICNDRSLDLICKDKDEAEVWFIGLKALFSNSNWRKCKSEGRDNSLSSDGSTGRKFLQSYSSLDPGDILHSNVPLESPRQTGPSNGLGKAFSDIILYTASSKSYNQVEAATSSLSIPSSSSADNSNCRSSTSDNFRFSSSSAVSSSSQGSYHDDFDSLGDVFIWGETIGEGILGGGMLRIGSLANSKTDASLPKALESTMVLDVHHIACGSRHAVLVTRQGESFSWGEESGGRLGHGADVDVSRPKLIEALSGMNIEHVACGEYHTCAVSSSGDLFAWGDGTHNSGVLGHGSEASHWIPKRVSGPMEGITVSNVSCGPWHTAVVTSGGQLFTFGDGTFGALGHGDRRSTRVPREVKALRGLRTLKVACAAWHTAALVEILTSETVSTENIDGSLSGKLFTWGDGDKGQLGHDDNKARLVPECVASLAGLNLCKVVCGRDLTVALTISGQVFTMGSAVHGQLGSPEADGKSPVHVQGKIGNCFIEDIASGSHHVTVLTSKGGVFTWGKGTNGQLGHGDYDDRTEPTFVDFFKEKQVKSVVCGSNFTAAICLHKWVSSADHSSCTGCHNPFNFRRKRHNCYNCGQVFCKICSSRRSLKASLAPNMNKPYRVCDDCFVKLKKISESGTTVRIPKPSSRGNLQKANEAVEKESPVPKFSAHFTKLSFMESLKRTDNSKSSARADKTEPNVLPHLNGKFQSGSVHSSSGSSLLFGASSKRISASAPASKMASRASSPISLRSSPVQSTISIPSFSVPASPEVVVADSNRTDDSSSQEIINLRTQIENLIYQNQCLQSELERTVKQLKEAKVTAADEAEKSRSAKEVIKSLTAQLKEIADRVQEGSSAKNKSSSDFVQTSTVAKSLFDENTLTGLMSPRSESNIRTMNVVLPNGNKTQPEKTEWVVQDEPGVYVTLSSLPGGGNELKRVRFSRKKFTEEQAGKWWTENGNKVCERHNVQNH